MGTDRAHGTQTDHKHTTHSLHQVLHTNTAQNAHGTRGDTYFCLSRASRVLLLRFCRLEGGTEWTEELFLLEEWEE